MNDAADVVEDWLWKYLDRRGYSVKSFLGRGHNGFAFLLNNGLVLKATSDEEEADCVTYIFEDELWKASLHLPVIYEMGSIAPVPYEILAIEEETMYDVRVPQTFYVREYLEPARGMVSPDVYDEQEEELETNLNMLGIRPSDLHPDNIGYRPGDWSTLVLMDVDCYLPDSN